MGNDKNLENSAYESLVEAGNSIPFEDRVKPDRTEKRYSLNKETGRFKKEETRFTLFPLEGAPRPY